jgi:hypothetical protein
MTTRNISQDSCSLTRFESGTLRIKQESYPLDAKTRFYVFRICYRKPSKNNAHVIRGIVSQIFRHNHVVRVKLNSEHIFLLCFTIKLIQRCKILTPSFCTPDEARSRDVTMILVKFWAGLSCKR